MQQTMHYQYRYHYRHLVLALVFMVATLSSPSLVQGRLAATTTTPSNNPMMTIRNQTLCDRIHPEKLPHECSCREPGPFSLVVECLKTFDTSALPIIAFASTQKTETTDNNKEEQSSLDNNNNEDDNSNESNTIGMKIVLDPCHAEGPRLSLDITEANHDIDWTLSGIRAGEATHIPIPGLAVMVPKLGHVGMDVAVLMTGTMDLLEVQVGLNACATVAAIQTICASNIPGLDKILPWYVLSGTYSFGDICSSSISSRDYLPVSKEALSIGLTATISTQEEGEDVTQQMA